MTDRQALELDPKVSEQPLSLGELVDLIDGVRQYDAYGEYLKGGGLSDGFRDFQQGAEPSSLRGFVTFSSPFYPQLADYYQEREEAWIERMEGRDTKR